MLEGGGETENNLLVKCCYITNNEEEEEDKTTTEDYPLIIPTQKCNFLGIGFGICQHAGHRTKR